MKKPQNKYTPGPWKLVNGWDKDGRGRLFPSVVLTDKGRWNRPVSLTVNESHDQERESLMANARLIAAAPELLEMLEAIYLDSAKGGMNLNLLLIDTKALIEKATTIYEKEIKG